MYDIDLDLDVRKEIKRVIRWLMFAILVALTLVVMDITILTRDRTIQKTVYVKGINDEFIIRKLSQMESVMYKMAEDNDGVISYLMDIQGQDLIDAQRRNLFENPPDIICEMPYGYGGLCFENDTFINDTLYRGRPKTTDTFPVIGTNQGGQDDTE